MPYILRFEAQAKQLISEDLCLLLDGSLLDSLFGHEVQYAPPKRR